jgi:purine-nucleoside/S-methyl-5'-thioadenosine phosphorylase / adenosine deaminase
MNNRAQLRLVTLPALVALPGVVHGYERRTTPTGAESREATRARVRAALDGTGRLLLMRQVHGAAVARAPWDGRPEADAGLATEAGLLLGVETADCLPILLVDPARRAVAAAHAGWRGTSARVAASTVAALAEAGSRPADLVVGIGPGIGSCCYEVGDELRAAFEPGDADLFRPGRGGRPHLDVRAANVRQLVAAGVRPDRIHHVDECTSCRSDLYHSYRRDGRGGGRMISFVGYARCPPGP